jgi:hypothetical protein
MLLNPSVCFDNLVGIGRCSKNLGCELVGIQGDWRNQLFELLRGRVRTLRRQGCHGGIGLKREARCRAHEKTKGEQENPGFRHVRHDETLYR